MAFVSNYGYGITSSPNMLVRSVCATIVERPPCTYASVSSKNSAIFNKSVFSKVKASRHTRLRRDAVAPIEMNISSNDFRTGTTIEMNGVPYRVIEFLHVKPGKGAAFVRTKLKNMKTGNNVDKTFKAGEMVQQATLEKIAMQHTYADGADYVFMNMESFDEERMTAEVLGENIVKFLNMGQEVEVLKHGDDVIGVELPKTLVFEITETEPGVKGNTASGNVLKPATITTGAEVMVPLFISIGDQVKVNTEDGKYVGRSNE